MNYGNVKLWFARNETDEIVTINEITEVNRNNTYNCPICGSSIIPRAIKSTNITSHFAHVDKSKCNSESMIHWWFKNKFLEKGDIFTVAADEVREYICKDVLVEQSYQVGDRTYRPDVTVVTECGNTIYFEMNNSNKKSVKDYLDIWLELKNIIVEVDVQKLTLREDLPVFKALFYEGKCFNTKKKDIYYNTIGKFKELKLKNNKTDDIKEKLQKLDWFWDDLLRYKQGEVDAQHMIYIIESIKGEERIIIDCILKKSICSELYNEYTKYKALDTLHVFNATLDMTHLIRKAIKELDKQFKKNDKKYNVVLNKETNYTRETKWFRGVKKTVRKVSSYYYKVMVCHERYYSYGFAIDSAWITNRIVDMKSVDEIVDHLNDKFINHKEILKYKLETSSIRK